MSKFQMRGIIDERGAKFSENLPKDFIPTAAALSGGQKMGLDGRREAGCMAVPSSVPELWIIAYRFSELGGR
jgi:hypothetical protein